MTLLALFCLLQHGTTLESTTAEKTAVKPGESINVTFKIAFTAGSHIYPTKDQDGTVPTVFKFERSVNVIGVVREPATKHHKDEYSDYDAIYESPAEFVVRVQVPEKAKPGRLEVKGLIEGQICNSQGCSPMDLTFDVTLTVAPSPKAPLAPDGKISVASVTVDRTDVKAGKVVKLTVKLAIEHGWHIYSVKPNEKAYATRFEFRDGAKIDGTIAESGLKTHMAGVEFEHFEGEATFVVPVRIPDGAKGAFKLRADVKAQPCDRSVCLDTETLAIEVDLKIATAAKAPASKVTIVSATFDAKAGKVGLKVSIEPGWHIYSIKPNDEAYPTKIVLEKAFATEGAVEEPAPKQRREQFQKYDYHEGTVTFVLPAKIAPESKQVKGTIDFMTCDEGSCLPPETMEFTAVPGVVEVIGSTPVAVPKQEPPPPSDAAATAGKEFQEKGWLWLIGFAIGGGLLSLVQPCVFPMIPITVTFFVKQSGESQSRPMLLGALYGLGIIVTFTALGFLLVLILGATGASAFAANPWVNLIIAGLFFAFALSMFGLFELQLPQFLTGSLTSGGSQKGAGGAFTLGLLFAVLSFTCTIPIAATILGIAASANRWAGLVGMLVYSTTMAIPFFLFGAFPMLLKRLPKGGGWLNTVKVTGGFLELGIAMAYIWKADFVWNWGIFTRWVVVSMWVALSGLTCLYLLGTFRMEKDGEAKPIGFLRLVFAILFGTLAVFVAGDALNMDVGPLNTVLPPKESSGVGPKDGKTAHVPVFLRFDEAEAEAKKTSKPIFLEFTAGN